MDQVNHLMVSVLREYLCIKRVYMYFEIECVICQENAAFKITLEIGDNLFFFDCQYSIGRQQKYITSMYFSSNTSMFCAEQKVWCSWSLNCQQLQHHHLKSRLHLLPKKGSELALSPPHTAVFCIVTPSNFVQRLFMWSFIVHEAGKCWVWETLAKQHKTAAFSLFIHVITLSDTVITKQSQQLLAVLYNMDGYVTPSGG